MQINDTMGAGCPACQGASSMDRGNASADSTQAFNRGMQGQGADGCNKASGQEKDAQNNGGQQNEQMMAMLMQMIQQLIQMIQGGSNTQGGNDANSNNQQQAKDRGDVTEEANNNKISKNDSDSNCNCG